MLVFILIVNVVFNLISGKAVKKTVEISTKRKNKGLRRSSSCIRERVRAILYKIRSERIGKAFAMASGIIAGAALVLIIGFVFSNGIPKLVSDPQLLIRKYEFGSEEITILPSIVTTLMAVVLSLAIAVPVGVMTAIFLNEYTKRDILPIRLIRTAIDILSGVPSIVYGLFGMITFVKIFGGSSSILAGSLTVSIMLIPTIVRSTEESLRSVEDSLREGSLALGAGKLRTVFKIVLPSALPGIISAVILSMGRVISESAPFLYTMGSVISAVPTGYHDSGATLAVALYQLSGEGWYLEEAYATAVVLVVIVLALNLIAEAVSGRLMKRVHGK